MLRYRIHMVFADGIEDSFDIQGDSLEDLRKQANDQVLWRNPVDYWSEKLS